MRVYSEHSIPPRYYYVGKRLMALECNRFALWKLHYQDSNIGCDEGIQAY